MKKIKRFALISGLSMVGLFFNPAHIHAQGISLAVSPPILEVMIAPGKEIAYEFTVSSLDSNVVLIPRITSFFPKDIYGDTEEGLSPPPPFVTIEQDSPFAIAQGEKKIIKIKIAPPDDSEEVDYYLRLTFETNTQGVDTNQNGSQATVKIASNILVTISKDGLPKKRAEIVKFEAPLIVDSFFPIRYSVIIGNIGNSYFKPIGKLDKQTLAPLNILSGYQRQIVCLDGEELIECKKGGKFHIGLVKSHLEFSLDDSPEIYSKDTETYAFPFILSGAVLLIVLLYRLLPLDRTRTTDAKSRY